MHGAWRLNSGCLSWRQRCHLCSLRRPVDRWDDSGPLWYGGVVESLVWRKSLSKLVERTIFNESRYLAGSFWPTNVGAHGHRAANSCGCFCENSQTANQNNKQPTPCHRPLGSFRRCDAADPHARRWDYSGATTGFLWAIGGGFGLKLF